MEKNAVREPRQQRAKIKKSAIVQAAYDLFCEKGYHQTNTAEIAKRAGVSTGIVYSYFVDKHDILVKVVMRYLCQLEEQLQEILTDESDERSMQQWLTKVMDVVYRSHAMMPEAHDMFTALALSDAEIGVLFDEFELKTLGTIEKFLCTQGVELPMLHERVRIGYGLIEKICHDAVRMRADDRQFAKMRDLAVVAIMALFSKEGQCEEEEAWL